MLNGANSRMLSHITNRTIKEEANKETRTFDVISNIRSRRLQWVGHILCMGEDSLVLRDLRHIYENRSEGDLLMDTPDNLSWRGLLQAARKREVWRK